MNQGEDVCYFGTTYKNKYLLLCAKYLKETKSLIEALREAAYNLKQAADGAIDYSRKRDDPCYQETYFREKAAAIRELIKEYET